MKNTFKIRLVASLSKLFDKHMLELLINTARAFIVKVLGAGILFVLNIVLARSLGVKDVGIYFLGVTIVTIIAVIGRAGLENAAMKYISSYSSSEDYGVVKGVYRQATLLILGFSTFLSVMVYVTGQWLSINIFSEKTLSEVIDIFAFSIVPLSLVAFHAEALKGLKRITHAVSVQNLFVPLITLIGVSIFISYFGLKGAAWSFFAANFITVLIAVTLWNKALVGKQVSIDIVTIKVSKLLNTSTPMLWVAIFQMINMWFATIALGILGDSEDVGIFNIASRTAVLTGFVLIAVNSIAAPKFAALYKQGDMETLGITARHSAKLATMMSLPFILLFIAVPEWVMSIFGEDFVAGSLVLTVVAVGQFINVATGSVGYLLMMSGNERYMRNNLFFCSVLNVILNILLIKTMGVIGAAIATSIVLIMQNLVAVLIAWKVLGILTIPVVIRLRGNG